MDIIGNNSNNYNSQYPEDWSKLIKESFSENNDIMNLLSGLSKDGHLVDFNVVSGVNKDTNEDGDIVVNPACRIRFGLCKIPAEQINQMQTSEDLHQAIREEEYKVGNPFEQVFEYGQLASGQATKELYDHLDQVAQDVFGLSAPQIIQETKEALKERKEKGLSDLDLNPLALMEGSQEDLAYKTHEAIKNLFARDSQAKKRKLQEFLDKLNTLKESINDAKSEQDVERALSAVDDNGMLNRILDEVRAKYGFSSEEEKEKEDLHLEEKRKLSWWQRLISKVRLFVSSLFFRS